MELDLDAFIKEKVQRVQEYALLSAAGIGNLFRRPLYWTDIFTQADLIGVGSLPIVILTGFFTGAVLALQSAYTLTQFGAKSITGELVSLSMIRELGPVLTGLVVSGRNASGMASELGSMQVTEQIDAMRALGTDPIKKLVTPRIVATVVMLFFLTIVADTVGMLGGGVISATMLGLGPSAYLHSSILILRYPDVIQGMVKPIFSGLIIATIGCFYGMTTKGGTQGVGRSTTQAVVASSVFIIAMDFIVSRFMIGLFGR
jgi:phospholipid/cholesterol/gamma-HCH transport system permease protein